MSGPQHDPVPPARRHTRDEELLTVEPTGSVPPSEAIVAAVARARGVSPVDLEDRLSDAVDPDALDNLFAARPDGVPRESGRIVVPMDDLRVILDTAHEVALVYGPGGSVVPS